MGGLFSEHHNKLSDQYFISQINKYDLVLLTETHVGYDTKVELDNFFYYLFCRKKSKNNRFFGGLGIFIRKNIRKGVEFMNNGNSEYQWLKLHKDFFGLRKDTFLCTVYFAPKSNINLLELLEKDILEKYGKKGDIILLGDFNARTGSNPDFIIKDSTTHMPIDNNYYDTDSVVEERISQDHIVDKRGKDLLDLCIGNQIRIVNGRCCGNSTGKFTCYKPNGCSVVDYVLVSEKLLSQVLYMEVSDFKANCSDCHCRLSIKILANFERELTNNNLKDFPLRYIWNNESVLNFQNSFSHPAIEKEIKSFIDTKINLDNDSIQTATDKIHSIFQKVCRVSLHQKRKKKKKSSTDKKWFDNELVHMKKLVNEKAELMSKYPKDPIIRGSFFKFNKQFAKLRKRK